MIPEYGQDTVDEIKDLMYSFMDNGGIILDEDGFAEAVVNWFNIDILIREISR